MAKKTPIRRGAIGRGITLSLAGARAGGAFAIDGALRRLRGDSGVDEERLQREADRFADTLGELKGSYVKIGQLLALLGEHFLPAPLTQALHRLESQTQPLDWTHIEPVLQSAMGVELEQLNVDHQALAAASLAQVHRAKHRQTKKDLVLKIQYPDLTAVLDEDFAAVVKMLRLARWIPASKDFDSWLQVLHEQLILEVDYPRELALAREMTEALGTNARMAGLDVEFHVPAYDAELSSRDVLVMDFVRGKLVTHPSVAALSQKRRDQLGSAMLELFFFEVFDLGLMQADPNFGNYLIGDKGKRITLLDFGSYVRLSEDTRSGLADTIAGGQQKDWGRLERGLTKLGCIDTDSSDHARRTFVAFVDKLLEPLRPPEELPSELLNARGVYRWADSQLLKRTGRHVAGSVASRDFSIPPGNFALMARKLTGVFTFISVVGAEFNGVDIVDDWLRRWGCAE
jgi:predicted unusual protein kinase regulating ubiquinone biosynthesis (AarF/ABC1/UbiB family)